MPPIFRIKFRRIRRRIRRHPKVSVASRHDYLFRKESARELIAERLEYFAEKYTQIDPIYKIAMKYRKVVIRNQRSRWGSCSSKKNLNFNYRILDLSPELRDYIVVHELCHLKELHHGQTFWELMEIMIPQARKLHDEARKMRIS